MDESELNGKAAAGVRFLEDGDAYAESDGRRMARRGDSLVLSVPGSPPYALTLFTEADKEPDVRLVWGEGPNVFVRVARHWMDGTPPQRVFSTMHIDVVARCVVQSADAKHPSDAVVALFKRAMQRPEIPRDVVAGHLRMSLEQKPSKRMLALMPQTERSDVLEAALQLPRHERADLAELLSESRGRSIHQLPGWGLEDLPVVPVEVARNAFVAVEKPSHDVSWGMDLGSVAWKVVTGGDGVTFTVSGDLHPETGPALPFPRSKQDQGRQHVLELPDGFLVGKDEGEWGGTLDFVARDGKRLATLAETNTHGIVRIADNIMSLHGLNHLGGRNGSIRFWTRTGDQFVSGGEHELDGGPECFTVSGNLLWVLTACGLWKIDGQNVEKVHAVDVLPFGAVSLVVDSTGDIWAGMRHFVLHFKRRGAGFFKRRGAGFDEEWLVKKDAEPPRPWPTYSDDEDDEDDERD